MQTTFNRRHLLGIRELQPGEINHLLDTAETFREVSKRQIKKVPALRGRTVINLFFEPSTRTRTSFEIAAKRLSADAVNVSVSTSSVTKGETLLDTARNLEAMAPDCIVIRHSMAGAPFHLARSFRQQTGLSLHQYRQHLRLAAAMERLADGDRDLAGIAHDLGCCSQSHLGAVFRRDVGVTMGEARRMLASARI